MLSNERWLAIDLILIVETLGLQSRCCNPDESWDYVKKILDEEYDRKVFWEYVGNIVSEIQKFVK